MDAAAEWSDDSFCRHCGGALGDEPRKRIKDGPFVYDPEENLFLVNGEPLRVIPASRRLLGAVMAAKGRPVAFWLLVESGGYEGDDPVNLARVLASRARTSIAKMGVPSPIETVRRRGFRWNLNAPAVMNGGNTFRSGKKKAEP